MTLLAAMQRFRDPTTDFVFPGAKRGTVISDATLRYLLQDMGYAGIATTHGMRATFRTWASETTGLRQGRGRGLLWPMRKANWMRPIIAAVYLDKRRRLMTDWSHYLTASNVIPLPAVASRLFSAATNSA